DGAVEHGLVEAQLAVVDRGRPGEGVGERAGHGQRAQAVLDHADRAVDDVGEVQAAARGGDVDGEVGPRGGQAGADEVGARAVAGDDATGAEVDPAGGGAAADGVAGAEEVDLLDGDAAQVVGADRVGRVAGEDEHGAAVALR